MGTNFYAKIPVKARDKERAKKLIDDNKFQEATELLNEFTKEIHLGKRSAGWKFLFNANDLEYYEPTREGINKFFSDKHVIIENEYGEKFTAEEFWDEIGDFLDKGYDIETYYRDHPEYYSGYYGRYPEEIYQKYKPNKYGEFYSDGLRFTMTRDFY